MKLFGFRLRTWLFFGIGFMAGSAVGRGPFERLMEMVEELRGGGSELGGNSFQPRMNEAANEMRDAVSGLNR
jgi:hypothetical protein